MTRVFDPADLPFSQRAEYVAADIEAAKHNTDPRVPIIAEAFWKFDQPNWTVTDQDPVECYYAVATEALAAIDREGRR